MVCLSKLSVIPDRQKRNYSFVPCCESNCELLLNMFLQAVKGCFAHIEATMMDFPLSWLLYVFFCDNCLYSLLKRMIKSPILSVNY